MEHEQRSPTDPPKAGPEAHLELAEAGDAALGRALALVRFLRARCPWDARQEPLGLRPYLLEEAHEVAEAIVAGDDEALATELGDLLLNVAFQIVLAEERSGFDAARVVERLETKMRVRHPHIYGNAEEPPDWEALKARERGERRPAACGADTRSSSDRSRPADPGDEGGADPFAGVPRALEPLSRALRVQDRAAALGFRWSALAEAVAKVEEEAKELGRLVADPAEPPGSSREPVPARRRASARVAEEVGDLLFAAVGAAQACGAHPSNALLEATEKFQGRFRRARHIAMQRGVEWDRATLAELQELWEEAKGD
ncbi:MAG: MazG family protein [Gemmatimonadota bacterium]